MDFGPKFKWALVDHFVQPIGLREAVRPRRFPDCLFSHRPQGGYLLHQRSRRANYRCSRIPLHIAAHDVNPGTGDAIEPASASPERASACRGLYFHAPPGFRCFKNVRRPGDVRCKRSLAPWPPSRPGVGLAASLWKKWPQRNQLLANGAEEMQ